MQLNFSSSSENNSDFLVFVGNVGSIFYISNISTLFFSLLLYWYNNSDRSSFYYWLYQYFVHNTLQRIDVKQWYTKIKYYAWGSHLTRTGVVGLHEIREILLRMLFQTNINVQNTFHMKNVFTRKHDRLFRNKKENYNRLPIHNVRDQ